MEISPLDPKLIARRVVPPDTILDIVDYPFTVKDGQRSSTVRVGITGQSHNPNSALGEKKLTQNELIQAAAAWLRSRIDKGECNPFDNQDHRLITVPAGVMDHWTEHREIPHWI